MKTNILYITEGGGRLAQKISSRLSETSTVTECREHLADIVTRAWERYDSLVFIMATGIVVRVIAPLLKDKHSDPAVVVCDERGNFAISLLSGHVGGANRLAEKIAAVTGGQPVITTASDVLGHTALDLWAEKLRLVVADPAAMNRAMGRLVNRGFVRLHSEVPLPELPPDIIRVEQRDKADIVISYRTLGEETDTGHKGKRDTRCLLHPPVLSVGMGCNRGTSAQQIGQAMSDACLENGLALQSVARIATIDIKRDEAGLIEFARDSGLKLIFFTKEQLNSVENVSHSDAVMKATGAKGVSEPAAILASGNGRLLVRKMKWKDVTTAIALDTSPWWEQAQGQQTW